MSGARFSTHSSEPVMPPPPDHSNMGAVLTGARSLHAAAYAKVNLSLEILGRRPDGFHELVSVSQIVSLADHLTVSPAADVHVTVDPPVVDEHDNLVRRAAEALVLATSRTNGATILLKKAIPLAAGLGGGSSDAATTLRLLDRLWGTRLGHTQLAAIAATLGSDVALFLAGGTSLMRGRGEDVEPLPAARTFWLVLICPGGSPPDKTRALYHALSPDEWSDGETTLALAERLRSGGTIEGQPFVNSFDRAADRVYPNFPALRRQLADLTDAPWQLTGAGPTLFARFATAIAAQGAAQVLQRAGIDAHTARTIARRPAIRASRAPAARFLP